MKLEIASFMIWAGCLSVLLVLDIGSFKFGFFGLMLTIAILMVFVIRAFLVSGNDS